MFKKSYKGRRIKLAAKKSLAVPVAIVTSFIVILAVSLSTLINKGLVNAFSDSVTPAPSTASTTSESTADLVKSTEISSSKENKANKEKVEESKPQSETTGESVEAAEKSQSDTATTSAASTNTDTTSTQILEQLLRLLQLVVGQLFSQMGTLQEKLVLMRRHRWQQLLVFLSQLGSQLLRVSQMVIILQQMVQVHQVFFKQCLDGALLQQLRIKFNQP